ncbi:MAG: glycosyltransferase 87 family protein [Actinomycetota bacterium]|nr:glycosyltransferase 87 family protein [Actinomycetota bacterium]
MIERRWLFAVLLLLTVALVVSGYLLKAQCKADYGADRDRLLCSNDIQYLYDARGLSDKRLPYLDGSLVEGQLTGGVLEYPVLTGLAAWLPSLFVDSASDYLTATAVLLAPFAFLSTWLLARMVRWRALIWAAGPPLLWYSFHNWDHLVVAATVTAFYLWWKGRLTGAAIALAVGASLKLWPGFFIVALVLWLLRRGDRRQAGAAGTAFAAAFALINGPFLLVNADGWWAPYAFQTMRAADITSNSIWFWGLPEFSKDTEQLNALVAGLLVVSWAAALAYGWWRSRDGSDYPWIQVSASMLCAFLLLNKVHSPQFALWLLPFFALIRLRWGWWATYLVFDSLLYVGLFRWYFDLGQGADFGIPKLMLVLGVWGRAAMLVLLFVLFLRSELALEKPRRHRDLDVVVGSRPDSGPGTDNFVKITGDGGEG